METSDLTLQYAAQLFVVGLNALVLVPLVLGWKQNRKPHLGLVCIAGFLEISRQIPNALLSTQNITLILFCLSLLLQFLASAIFLAALFRLRGPLRRRESLALALPSAAFLGMLATLLVMGLFERRIEWLIASLPLTALSALVFIHSFNVRRGISAGKLLLIASTYVLLAFRVFIPFLEESDLFYLMYYLENLMFPLLLASIVVLELEIANEHIASLHAQRTQSEQELKFVVDNALDVILMTDEVGLLKNWNKPAEAIFGYSAGQTVGKMHIDELFVDRDWQKRLDEYAEFHSRIEHLEGGVHDVHVRMQSVVGKQGTHMVFMIRDVSALEHHANAGMASTT